MTKTELAKQAKKKGKSKGIKKPKPALDHLMDKHKAASERAKHARTFIRKTRGFKHSNETVKSLRECYLASARVKGISLAVVAGLYGIPVSTVIKLIYSKEYRQALEAQPDMNNLAVHQARLEQVMRVHRKAIALHKKNKLTMKQTGYNLKQKHQMLSATASKEDVPDLPTAAEPEVDYTSLSPAKQVVHDNLEFTSRDQIIYAVQEWMRSNGKSCPSILGQLVTQISRSTGVNA